MYWSREHRSDSRVVKAGTWTGSIEHLPSLSGVFIFVDDGLQVKYVGEADLGRLQLEAKAAIKRGDDRGATKVLWLATESHEDAKALAEELIVRYQPPNNAT